MSWRVAFLEQARSDNEVRRILNRERVAHSHQLHYLQMVCEKLAKAYLSSPTSSHAPAHSHVAFVRLLQVIKGQPEIRSRLGYTDRAVFAAFIDSLLPDARRIEMLAPSVAGNNQPNPEYPWKDPVTNNVCTPATFEFADLDPTKPQIVKLEKLVSSLLSITI